MELSFMQLNEYFLESFDQPRNFWNL